MSKKRPSFEILLDDEVEAQLDQPATQTVEQPAALSRDSAVTLSREEGAAPQVAQEQDPVEAPAPKKPARKAEPAGPRRRSPNDNTRHSYHASLYLPEEAQFALREIALAMRKPKPHDVMLEAMAELFEKYNKGKVAKACRARITPSRDKAVT